MRPEVDDSLATFPVTQCPLCGSDDSATAYDPVPDFKYGVAGAWKMLRCGSCGVAYLSPRLVDGSQGYPSHYRQHHGGAGTAELSRSSGLRARVRSSVLRSYGYEDGPGPGLLGRALRSIPYVRVPALWSFLLVPPGPATGRLLDVGCGNGRFLQAMAALGWEVYGVEPDPESARLASESTGAVVVDALDDPALGHLSFDVVTMNHVIEHVPDPLDTLRSVHKLCGPDAALGLVTPNWSSLLRRVYGAHWYAMEPPRHLVLFEPRHLVGVLEGAGFEVTVSTTTSVREAWVAWAKSHTFRTGRAPSRRLLPLAQSAGALASMVGMGEEIVTWARKQPT